VQRLKATAALGAERVGPSGGHRSTASPPPQAVPVGAEQSDRPLYLYNSHNLKKLIPCENKGGGGRGEIPLEAKIRAISEPLLRYRKPLRDRLYAEAARRREVARSDPEHYGTKQGDWHTARARNLSKRMIDRIKLGRARLTLENSVTGELRDICTCAQPLCIECGDARVKKFRKRIKAAVATVAAFELNNGRRATLVTLTIRHTSGDPAEDARHFRAAWKLFHAWLRKFIGHYSYMRTQECTPGTEIYGHVHWHLTAWLPDFVDYTEMINAWWRALAATGDGEGVTIDLVHAGRNCRPRQILRWVGRASCAGRDDGGGRPVCGEQPCSKHAPGAVHVSRRTKDSAKDAMLYATKVADKSGTLTAAIRVAGYATKGSKKGKGLDGLDDDALAKYLAGEDGQRKIATSRYLWRGGEPGPLLSPPPSDWVASLRRNDD